MSATELSALLWRERELLELLIFKLEEEQLLLTAGKSRWIQHATREVEQVMNLLRESALGRTVAVAALAMEWGTAEDASLRDLVDNAPAGPWSEIFMAHLAAMSDLTAQIRELRDVNLQFLRSAARGVQETLATIDMNAATYDATGSTDSSSPGARFFDQKL